LAESWGNGDKGYSDLRLLELAEKKVWSLGIVLM
jgi:hypothetical protein